MNASVVVSARMASSRLPGKAMYPLAGLPMLAFLLRRLKSSKRIQNIVLATTQRTDDDVLARWARAENVLIYRGDENNLVARYVGASKQYPSDYVIRITADCPFVDGALLDHCIAYVETAVPFDLATTKGTYPIGFDCEIYRASLMSELLETNRLTAAHREHLTLYLYDHRENFHIIQLPAPENISWVGRSFTVDTAEDYSFASALIRSDKDIDLTMPEILDRARAL